MANGLVSHLRETSARQDRAALAALRRGLGKSPGQAPEMFPHVAPFIPERATAWDEACHYLVASLYALHPMDWTGDGNGHSDRNFGVSVNRIDQRARAGDTPEKHTPGIERRFVALLDADAEDVGEHLRSLVALLAGAGAPVDWQQLLDDLRFWHADRRDVQRRWARAYWGASQFDGAATGGDSEESAGAEAGQEGNLE
jgi:CRISPR system Cascade subunit CasB